MKKLIGAIIGLTLAAVCHGQGLSIMKSTYLFSYQDSNGYYFTNAPLPIGAVNVVVWGATGNALRIPSDLTNAVAVATGYGQCVALNSNGTVEAWGDGIKGDTNVPALSLPSTQVAAGKYWCSAVLSDGSVTWWGQAPNTYIPPGGLSNVYEVQSAGTNAIVLDNYGNVTVLDPLVTSPTIANALSVSGDVHRYAAVLSDGSVTEWGLKLTNAPILTNAVCVSMGTTYTVAGLSDGSAVYWGTNGVISGTIVAPLQSIDTGTAIGALYFNQSNVVSHVGGIANPVPMSNVGMVSARFGFPAATYIYSY